jgi:hypothetical protein
MSFAWYPYTVNWWQLAAGGASLTIALDTLVGGTMIHGVKMKHTAAFTGGGVSQVLVSVGLFSDTSRYATGFDVFPAPSSSRYRIRVIEPHGHDSYDNTGGQTIDGTAATVSLSSDRTMTRGSRSSRTGGEITVTQQGQFQINYRLTVESSMAAAEYVRVWLERDNGGGFVKIDGSDILGNFATAVDSKVTVAAAVQIDLQAGDKIKMVAQRQGTGTQNFLTVADGSGITLEGPTVDHLDGNECLSASFSATGGNLSDLTSGSMAIWVLMSRPQI